MTTELFGGTLALDAALAVHLFGIFMGGLARGFTGFGGALIVVPITSAVYGPAMGVPLLTLVDTALTLPFVVAATRHCIWREVLPIGIAAMAGVPLGVMVLTATDPVMLRWGLCLLIGLFVVALASGWRYRRRIAVPALLGVGGTAGIASGSTGIGGPPIILFWLGGQGDAPTVRANVFMFFGLISLSGLLSFGGAGLFTPSLLTLVAVSVPVYALALWLGSRLFAPSRETLFRRLALGFCSLAAIAGLPAFDGLLR